MQLLAALAHWQPADETEAKLRDRGIITWQNLRFRFGIQYYDNKLEWSSDDPADAEMTVRILTITLITE
jgi:hypothetical protein